MNLTWYKQLFNPNIGVGIEMVCLADLLTANGY
jgi:hypothetical protein